MRITVLLFAHLAETVGERELTLDLPDPPPPTVDAMLAALARRHPALGTLDGTVAVAVNEQYRPRDHRLNDGDTAALIPPVSGG